MKTIIAKTQMVNDPLIVKIKAFRILNKRAGEFKRTAMDESNPVNVREEAISQYKNACEKLKVLATEAEAAGFHLWVNTDGTTGHTYSKDYKITSDDQNDWSAFQTELAALMGPVEEVINNIDTPEDDDSDPSMN